MAEIAVVVSVDSILYDGESLRALYGLCEALLRKHHLFDILIAETLTPEQLARYRIAIVVQGACYPQLAARILMQRLREGMGILLTGDCRIVKERFKPDVRMEDYFRKRAVKSTATGRFEVLPFQPSELFNRFNEFPRFIAEKAEKLDEIIKGMSRLNFGVIAERDWLVVAECRASRDEVIVHLLNYNFDIYPMRRERDKIDVEKANPISDIDITVPLPRGVRARRVLDFSPDHPPLRLAFSEFAGVVAFRLPELKIYDLVVIETTRGM